MSRLYTYLPKDNTALTEGLLSTALSDRGFEKYRGRTGKYRKEDVLKVLDSWEPEWTRSKAISALTEPIPEDAAEEFLEFARNRRLYSFDTKDLIKAKILAHIRRARKGGGTDPVDEAKKERPNWHRKKKHLLFQEIPHYFVETTGGKIPPEFVTEEKKAEMSRDRIQAQYARHPQESLARLAKRLAKKKWSKSDIIREDAAHADEFGITGEDKEYLDRYIIARIAENYDRKARIKQGIMKALWEKEHNGEVFDAALPARMARFRQYEDVPFGIYNNDLEKKKFHDRVDGDWGKYLKTAEDIESMARKHYPEEGSHGWNHIQDVIAAAKRMRRRELLKKELAAIMYHDSSLMAGNRETHAEDSAEIARNELAGKFSKRDLKDIVNAIAHHRASYEGSRKSRLEDLVAAADRPVPDVAKQILRSWKYHEELGEPYDIRAKNVADHLKEKYGHGGYAYKNAPRLYFRTYGDELNKAMGRFDGLTPVGIVEAVKKNV